MPPTDPPTARRYLSGFGNEFATEAVAGALPVGRNSPQRAPFALVPELVSGTAFTAPRASNRRSWLYRRLPSVVGGRFVPYAQTGAPQAGGWTHHTAGGPPLAPAPLRWLPFALPDAPVDFVDGLHTVASCGDVEAQTGMTALVYLANRSMDRRALVDADGELLLVPQQGRLVITTEQGVLDVRPGEIALLPRGLAFQVALPDGPSRGYVCENHGAPFRLPELGPIGSNGLANARDFLAPVAAFDATIFDPAAFDATAFDPAAADGTATDAAPPFQIVKKFGGRLWAAQQPRTPFDVVAWHGNLAPLKYDTATFMAIGSISFDHPDPSIFTVLTSPSDTPGTANVDFVIFPPRWLVADDTFRPPWYHRNAMSEFMGLVHGRYDAKPQGFLPGGATLHNAGVAHGPDAEAFEQATAAALQPHKLDGTLAFMFESRLRLVPSAFALASPALDAGYADCWAPLQDRCGRRAG